MRIGELARRTGISVQTLRYYEARGLLLPPKRRASGYRQYAAEALRRVRFIKRAQHMGFTLNEISDLLALWDDSVTSCPEVAKRATKTLERLDARLRELNRMRGTLLPLITACHQRRDEEECPLLVALGEEEQAS